ncbi:MAG TPA: dihydrolipoamide acetyltransferase family protein [Streptosporangiaceae bacterium]|jgi:pyruvate dehydrogenase E2 component (dihydrolipoamide acetyltransferase)
MPALGADMDEGTLVEWLVKPGDQIHKGDIIAVVDTAKSAIEVESFHTGTIKELITPAGETVPVGTVLATITAEAGAEAGGTGAARGGRTAEEGEAGLPGPAEAGGPVAAAGAEPGAGEAPKSKRAPGKRGPGRARPARKPGPPGPGAPARSTPLVRQEAAQLGVDLAIVRGSGRGGTITRADVEHAAASRRPRVTPLARRLAAELGIDLGTVTGTGPGGAIREADVRRAASAGPPPATRPAAQPSATVATPSGPAGQAVTSRRPGKAERAESMRQAIARLMARSKREIPHYYVSNTVDMGAAMGWLRERNRSLDISQRLVPAALLLRATALAARQVPELNGYWTEDHFVPGPAVHLGVAISLRGGGLITPAIHDAADLAAGELMGKLRDLVNRARAGRLRSSELTDATITVTNLGDQGVESVTGVIYPPQVALVGFGKIAERPWAVGGLLGIRPVVVSTLAADHRATDGYTGARFLTAVAELLQRPEEL